MYICLWNSNDILIFVYAIHSFSDMHKCYQWFSDICLCNSVGFRCLFMQFNGFRFCSCSSMVFTDLFMPYNGFQIFTYAIQWFSDIYLCHTVIFRLSLIMLRYWIDSSRTLQISDNSKHVWFTDSNKSYEVLLCLGFLWVLGFQMSHCQPCTSEAWDLKIQNHRVQFSSGNRNCTLTVELKYRVRTNIRTKHTTATHTSMGTKLSKLWTEGNSVDVCDWFSLHFI